MYHMYYMYYTYYIYYYRPGFDHTTNYFRQGCYSLDYSLSDHNRNLGINNSILVYCALPENYHFATSSIFENEHGTLRSEDGFKIKHKCWDSENSSVKCKPAPLHQLRHLSLIPILQGSVFHALPLMGVVK